MTALLFREATVPPPDSVRVALQEVFARREYDWETHTSLFAWLREQFLWVLAWMDRLEHSHPVSFYVLVLALALVLLAIVAHFAYVLRRAFAAVEPETPAGSGVAAVRQDAAWHLAEALRLSAAGRYSDALSHRFLALVLELDRRKALRFHSSKTPAEYVGEASMDEHGRGRLRALVLALYRHVFGAVPCTAREWIAFDREAAALGGEVPAAG